MTMHLNTTNKLQLAAIFSMPVMEPIISNPTISFNEAPSDLGLINNHSNVLILFLDASNETPSVWFDLYKIIGPFLHSVLMDLRSLTMQFGFNCYLSQESET